jgi:hypothetical protein
MIQVMLTIDENEPFGQFLIARAHETGKHVEEVAQTEPAQGFHARVRMLHEQFIR